MVIGSCQGTDNTDCILDIDSLLTGKLVLDYMYVKSDLQVITIQYDKTYFEGFCGTCAALYEIPL